MALKPCRECKKKVSTEASTCPSCGVPNPTIIKEKTIDTFKNVNMHCPDIHCDEYRIVKSSPAGKTSYKCEKCNYELTDSKKLLSKGAKEIKKVSVDNNNHNPWKETNNRTKRDDGNIFGFWRGGEGLIKTFWLYFIVANMVGNVLVFGAESEGSGMVTFVSVIQIGWNILAVIGVFNAADIYKNKKIQSGQPYGYATAAKIAVVVLILSAIGNSIR